MTDTRHIIAAMAEHFALAINEVREAPNMPAALEQAGADAHVYVLDDGLVVTGAGAGAGAVWVPLE